MMIMDNMVNLEQQEEYKLEEVVRHHTIVEIINKGIMKVLVKDQILPKMLLLSIKLLK